MRRRKGQLNLYWITVYERYAFVGSGQSARDFHYQTPLIIKGEGVMVYMTEPYNGQEFCDLPSDIKMGCMVQQFASPASVLRFLSLHRLIDKGPSPAVWTEPDEDPIIQVPFCDQLYEPRDGGDAQCGPPGSDGKSALGTCFLDAEVNPRNSYWPFACKAFEFMSNPENMVAAGLARKRKMPNSRYTFIIPR